jgi:catalase
VLLQDQHLREKITHFDHERVPERVVHARGAATHGVFRGYGTAAQISKAAFLAKDVETPVFVRFSTVLGSRGSADTARGAAASLRSSTPKRASSTWFHRRDLADAIEAGAFPQWELGVQTFPDNPEQMFEGIDLLDPTKIVPEELAPVQPSA